MSKRQNGLRCWSGDCRSVYGLQDTAAVLANCDLLISSDVLLYIWLVQWEYPHG